MQLNLRICSNYTKLIDVMEQNVVFENPQNNIQPPQPQVPSTTIPQTQQSPFSTEIPLPPPGQPLGSNLPPSPPLPPQSPIGEILSIIPKWVKLAAIAIGGVVLLIIILLVVISSRGKQKPEHVALKYWGLWEDSSIMNAVIDDFQRQYPNITVNYSKEDPKQYSERLLARSQNGTGPDVFRYHNTWVPELSPILLPLSNDVITKDQFKNTFYKAAQDDLIKNGAIYGVPLGMEDLVLLVNNSIFQAAGAKVPATWDNFLTTAKQLTVKDENGKIKTAGAALGTYDNITHAPDIVSLLFIQNGVDIKDLTKNPKNASDALNFYSSFAKSDGNVWDNTLDPSMMAFAKANLAMYFGYSWDIFTIKAINPNLDFSIHPVPHLLNRNVSIASYWVEGASAKGKHPKEALLFMHYLTQKDTAEKFYTEAAKTRLFGEPYARVDLADKLKDNPYLSPVVSQAKDAVSTYFTGETQDTGIDAQMNGYLGNAVRSLLVGNSADSAITTLSQGVNQVLHQYGQ